MKVLRWGWVGVALSGVGCASKEGDTGAASNAEDTTPGDTAGDDSQPDSGAAAGPPCADGGWGAIVSPDDAIHVREDGAADGDGSQEDPVDSLAAALVLTRALGEGQEIAFGGGEFDTSIAYLLSDLGDDGLSIHGCGPDETRLVADDDGASLLHVTEVQELELGGFAVEGGRIPLFFSGGATTTTADVRVQNPTFIGIDVEGGDHIMSDVEILSVEAEDSSGVEVGFGLLAHNATLSMTGGGVEGATTLGIFADSSDLTLSGVSVSDTSADSGGALGRGLQLQGYSTAAVQDSVFSGNADAGIFSVLSVGLTIEGATVADTSAGAIPDSSETTGDGIVISRGEGDPDVSSFPSAYVADCDISGFSRAGVLLDGMPVELGTNTLSTDGLGDSIYAQNDADVTGETGDVVTTELLELNYDLLNAGDFTP